MEKLVVLSFGNGDVVNGFASVRAQLWDVDRAYPIQVTGGLPGAPELPSLYRQWQLLYLALHHRLGIPSRIKIKAADVTNVSEMEFNQFCQRLSDQINYWLSSAAFRPIDQQLRTWLNASDEVRIIIETNDSYLRQLPWHLWHFFAAYPHAEVALSLLNYQRSRKSSPIKHTAKKARILAILGDSQDIDVHRDRSYLEQLSTQAEIHFLVEPKREELNHQLWQGWDLLFFAGHSTTQETGFLRINPMENLSLEQLRWALNHAITNGLKLAIFNSCDGLGLAQSLADLQIPQVIVMREPVPDVVAQAFLKHFLAAFVSGRSLYTSVREARERLQGMEGTYPCASWLPVICQNPAEVPIRWEEWGAAGREKERGQDRTAEEKQARDTQPATHSTSQNSKPKLHNLKSKMLPVLLSSVMVTTLVMGMRYVGGLQAWELQAFDQLMRSRPEEPQDSRLLIVTVTEDDFQLPEQQQRQGSLSDLALAKVIDKLTAYQPRAIGLDIYRDFPVSSDQPKLRNQIRQNTGFFAICKGSEPGTQHPGIAPPPEVPLERQGFSDLVKDPDNVLRRHLVVMDADPASPCTTPYAISAQLALYALAAENIPTTYTAQGELKVGNVRLRQLKNHQGGYHQVDTWGYQILLNYRSHRTPANIAPTVTLKQVLTNQIRPEDVNGRIVLIGVTALSAGDVLATPFSSKQSSALEMPGVFAQAQMVSQIISAVKDGRPLLEVWSTGGEWFWVWGWALAGGVLIVWCRRSRLMLVISGGVALGVLYLLCLQLLIHGKWVPFVPSALAFIGTGISMISVSQRKLE